MTSIMQQRLGDAWAQLPPALQAHYGAQSVDSGHLSVRFPPLLRPFFWLLSCIGALLSTRGEHLPTQVVKKQNGTLQHWCRRIRYPNGKVRVFNSQWQLDAKGRLVEYVNPFMGLQMRPWVQQGRLYYRGECYVFRLGPLQLRLPESCGLGRCYVEEWAISDTHFAMDFKLVHPLFGQWFCYCGEFEAKNAGDDKNGA